MPAYASDDETEFVGDIEELQQESPDSFDIRPIRVDVEGPVQVHSVPSISSGSRSFTIAATEAFRVANRDPRRRSATLISIDEAFYVASTSQECTSATAALWPETVPLVVTHGEEIWVRAEANTTTLSLLVENWAS